MWQTRVDGSDPTGAESGSFHGSRGDAMPLWVAEPGTVTMERSPVALRDVTNGRAVLPIVLMQHVEEAASLRSLRSSLLRAPDSDLFALSRLDQRLVAHLHGVALGDRAARDLTHAALEATDRGSIFVAVVRALEDEDALGLDAALAFAQSSGAGLPAAVSAFGWVSPARLRGVTKALLDHDDPFRQRVGLGACGAHRVDPGTSLSRLADDPDAGVRLEAFRIAGRCGRVDLRDRCIDHIEQNDESISVAASIAAAALGDRGPALSALEAVALDPVVETSTRLVALRAVCQILEPGRAAVLLERLAKLPGDARALVIAVGQVGQSQYVPWLLERLHEAPLARLAGESLTLITGLDVEAEGLGSTAPSDHVDLVDDDPGHERVEMDEDDGLPWPDPGRIAKWWQVHEGRFPLNARTFMGHTPDSKHCIRVLRTGSQRQRMVAAAYLRLSDPAKPLFNVAAPAWRQQRLLEVAAA